MALSSSGSTTGPAARRTSPPEGPPEPNLDTPLAFTENPGMGSRAKSDPTSRSTEAALRERVKELTCLYGIAQVAARPGASLEEVLQGIVELLPPGWQYPDVTAARIVLDGLGHATSGFREVRPGQTADIVVTGHRRGAVEVIYTDERPELDEGPFLKEERSLIDAVAGQVALIVERREAEEDRARLQDQLRHADRLATIGQLAAGVAHELNEPLSNVLGFAQLAKKCPELPGQAREDIEQIEPACLHARDIIGKLLVFARQTQPQRSPVDLNQVIQDGLTFFAARFTKDGTEVALDLAPGPVTVIADPAQLNQVLVNLVVNALQAMPGGGQLTVRTRAGEGQVSLVVKDTGEGMSEDVLDKVFVPFFTTKDVGEGTGLGLPVVHGIVTSHGASIKVESNLGQGTRFEILLPLTGGEDSVENG